MHRNTRIAIVALGLAVIASPALAEQISFNGMGLYESVSYKLDGSSKTTKAGQLLVDFGGEDYAAYCVDLRHAIKNDWSADFEPVSSFSGGKAAAFLYDTFATTVTTNIQAAALQVAIWEVVEDWSTINLFGGDFKFTKSSAVTNLAQSFLNALPGDLSNYVTTSFILESGNSPRSQNLIVPEPATVAALLLGLPILLRGRRKAA